MIYKFTIPCTLPGLNEYIAAERSNRFKAAKLKKETEALIMAAAMVELHGVKIRKPVIISYTWVEKTKRRDRDNISFARKFVQDALVRAGILLNDGWGEILMSFDNYKIDSKNPRVEVEIEVTE